MVDSSTSSYGFKGDEYMAKADKKCKGMLFIIIY